MEWARGRTASDIVRALRSWCLSAPRLEPQGRWTREAVFLAGLAFFLAYRFYLAWAVWHGRSLPPEPDDAYAYLSLVSRIEQWGLRIDTPVISQDWFGQNILYLPWVLLMYLLHLLTGLDLEQLYRLNYFLGLLVLGASFAFVLRRIAGPIYAGLGMFFLGWSWGVGVTFYYIRPVTYLVALSLVYWCLLWRRHPGHGWIFALLAPLMVLLHPIGMVVLLMAVLFFFLDWGVHREMDRGIAGGLLWSFLALGLMVAAWWARAGWSAIQEFFVTPTQILVVVDDLSKRMVEWLSGGVFTAYFDPQLPLEQIRRMAWWQKLLLLHPREVRQIWASLGRPVVLMSPPFLLGMAALWWRGRRRLPLWWAVGVFTMLLFLKTPYSHRFLEFVWPPTMMAVAYGYYLACLQLLAWRKEGRRFPALLLLAVVLASFSLFALSCLRRDELWIREIRNHQNFVWDRSCPQFLRRRCGKDTFVVYQGKLGICSFLTYGLWRCPGKTVYYVEPADLRGKERIFYVRHTPGQSRREITRVFRRLLGRPVRVILVRDCGEFSLFRVIPVPERSRGGAQPCAPAGSAESVRHLRGRGWAPREPEGRLRP